MGCGLLVAHEDMVKSVAVIIKRIVHGHDGTAGVAKKGFHPFVQQCAHKDFRTCYFFSHIAYLIYISEVRQ